MIKWNASHYLRYGTERTRAAADLLARINLRTPHNIVDIGCGPGNSTALLWRRWPESKVVGIDNSTEMITAARETHPDRQWLQCDASQWNPTTTFALIFSNAALMWLPEHENLVQRLFSKVAPGGALAFQIPSANYAMVRRLIFDISHAAQWEEKMHSPRSLLTMESPAFYYDTLVADASSLDIWETEYMHVMDSHMAIVDWIRSTGLRPFLEALDTEAQRQTFTNELYQRVTTAYELRLDGKVLFPFRRTFVIAYR